MSGSCPYTLTVTASWTPCIVNISYNLDDGSTTTPVPVRYDTINNHHIPTPFRTGYHFAGWYTTTETTPTQVESIDGLTTKIQWATTGDDSPCPGTLNLKAKWDTLYYTLTFNANTTDEVTWGDCFENPMSESTVGGVETRSFKRKYEANITVFGECMDQLSSAMSRAGYKLTGWADGNGTPVYYNSDIIDWTTGSKPANVTLYAQWVVAPSCHLYTNGGDFTSACKSACGLEEDVTAQYKFELTEDQHINDCDGLNAIGTDAAAYFTKEGYHLVGWCADEALTQPFSFGGTFTGIRDTSAYALWEPNPHTVTFYANGTELDQANFDGVASRTYKETTIKYDSAYRTATPNASGDVTNWFNHFDVRRTGFDFVGWYGDQVADNANSADSIRKDSLFKHDNDLTKVYAGWKAKNYEVTFLLQKPGSTTPQVTPLTMPVTYNAAYGDELPTPTCDGYEFAGWYLDPEYTEPAEATSPVRTPNDHNLYAKWTAKTVNVVFNANKPNTAGEVTWNAPLANLSNQTYPSEFDNNLFTESWDGTLSLTGYTFRGFYKDAVCTDGNEVTYQTEINNTNFPTPLLTWTNNVGEVNIYAKWTPDTFNLAYDLNDGTGTIPDDAKKVVYDEDYPLWTPTRTGYTFAGWCLEDDCEHQVTTATTVTKCTTLGDDNNTITLHANWTANTVNVVFNANVPDATTGSVTWGSMLSVLGDDHTYAGKYDNDVFTGDFNASGVVSLPGYTFGGFYKDASCTQAVSNTVKITESNFTIIWSDGTPKTGTVNLYAKWTANDVNVVFNANVPDATTGSVTWGSMLSALGNDHTYAGKYDNDVFTGDFNASGVMSLPGYTFGGFYKDASCTQAVSNTVKITENNFTIVWSNGTPKTGTVNLYAKWTPKPYKITLHAKIDDDNTFYTYQAYFTDVTPHPTQKNVYIDYDSAYKSIPGWMLFDAERQGFHLTGWKTQDNVLIEANHICTENDTLEAKLNWYAQWEPNEYTLTYNLNLQSDNTTPTVMPASKPVTFSQAYGELPTPTCNGYKFDGWFKEVACTNKAADTTICRIPADHEIYAKWTADTCTVTFNGNAPAAPEGVAVTPPSSSETQTFDANYVLPADPTCPGYDFKGWYPNADGSGTKVTESTKCTTEDDHTLYAKWQRRTYHITVHSNGGYFSNTTTQYYVAISYLAKYKTTKVSNQRYWENDFGISREGYQFAGWWTDPVGGVQRQDDDIYTQLGNEDLYAHWTPKTYTCTVQDYTQGDDDHQATVNCSALVNSTFIATFGQTFNASLGCDLYTDIFCPGFTKKWQVYKVTGQDWIGNDKWNWVDFDPATQIWDVERDQSIKAVWSKNTNLQVTVHLDANGGTVNPSQYDLYYWYKYGSNYRTNRYGTMSGNSNAHYLTNNVSISRTGYTFAGWWYNDESIYDATPLRSADAHTLTARWTANDYTVKVHANGGTLPSACNACMTPPTTFKVKYDHPMNYYLSSCTGCNLNDVTREGYTFGGWYMNEACTGNALDFNGTWLADYDVDIYAKWLPNEYTVTFDANAPADATVTLDTTSAKVLFDHKYQEIYNVRGGDTVTYGTLPTPNCTSLNYVFRGWFINGTGDEIENTTSCTTAENHTLVARWEPVITATLSQDSVSCHGFTDGKVTVRNISGGDGDYTVTITKGDASYSQTLARPASSVTFTGTDNQPITAGEWTVTVFDAAHPESHTGTGRFNCRYTGTIVVLEPDALAFTATPSPQTCNSQGSVAVSVTGGNGQYTLTWTGSTGIDAQSSTRELAGEHNPATDSWSAATTVTDLLAQNVTLHVTDQKGCPVADTMVVIGQPEETVPAFADVAKTVCSGSEFILPENRPPGVRYSWSLPTGAGCTGAEPGQMMPSVSGTLTNTTDQQQVYTYTVTPYKGILCIGEPFTVTVTVGPNRTDAPTVATVTSPDAGCARSDREIAVSFNNAVSNVTYQVNGGYGSGSMTAAATPVNTYKAIVALPDTCHGDIGFSVAAVDGYGCDVQGQGFLHVRIAPWSIAESTYGSSEVTCLAEAVAPVAPTNVIDGCGNTLAGALTATQYSTDNGANWTNAPFACAGQVRYTYTFNACDGSSDTWTYTYTVTGRNGDTIVVNNPVASIPADSDPARCIFQVPDLRTEFLNKIESSSTCSAPEEMTFAQVPQAGSFLNTSTDVAVTLTDKCGQTSHYTVTVTVPVRPIVSSVTATEIACNGGTSDATVTVNNGTAPYTYVWNDGLAQTGQTATDLVAGSYTVTVTDANGCVTYGFVTIAQPSAVQVAMRLSADTICAGGSVVVSAHVSGGTAPYVYRWNNDIDSTLSVSPIQTLEATTAYTLSIKDAKGCVTDTLRDTVVVNPLPAVAMSGATICLGDTAVLTATGAESYVWSNGQGGAEVRVSPAATAAYTVTGTDAKGCRNMASDTVKVQTLPAITIMNHPEAVAVDDTTAVSVRPLEVNEVVTWHIENHAGSTAGEVALIDPYVQNVAGTNTSVKIKGIAVGKVVVSATITDTTNLAACNSVTVADTIKVRQSVITLTCPEPSQDSIIYTGLPHSIADTVAVKTSAGEDITNQCTWSYSIDGQSFSPDIPTRTEVGSTQVTVKATHEQYESNTCQYTLTVNRRPVTIKVTDCASWNGSPITTEIAGHYEVTTQDSTLVGNDQITGQVITSSAIGGVYTYSDALEVNTASKTNVQVKRGDNSVTANYDIRVISSQTVMQLQVASVTGVTCSGKSNGEIEVTVTPDSNTYIYYIGGNASSVTHNSAGTETYNQLAAGTYSLYVTNASGTCQTNTLDNVVVEDVEPIAVLPVDSVIDICEGATVALSVESVTGGSEVYDYEWRDTRKDSVVGTTATVLNVQPADTTVYTLTVRDARDADGDCAVTVRCTVQVRPGFPTHIVAEADRVCKDNLLEFTETLNATDPHCHYKWTTLGGEYGMVEGSDTNSTASARWTTAGPKRIAVTVSNDSTGCNSTGFYDIVVDTLPVVFITSDKETLCFGEDSVTLSVPDVESYQYVWNVAGDPDTFQIKVGAAGNYTVTVTDGNGCTTSATRYVGAYDPFTVYLNEGNTSVTICPGQQTATLSATPVKDNYTYVWSHNNTVIDTLATNVTTLENMTEVGFYQVKVIDTTGCYSMTNTVELKHRTIPTVVVNNASVCESGTAQLKANGAQNYTWAPVDYLDTVMNYGDATFHGVTAGTYTVTVTGVDAHGCWATAVSTIKVRPEVVFTVNNPDLLHQSVCAGTSLDSIKFHVENGSLQLEGSLPQYVVFHHDTAMGDYNNDIDGLTYQTGTFPFLMRAVSNQTDPVCPTKEMSGVINVNPAVEITMTPQAQDVCVGNAIDTVLITCENGKLPAALENINGLVYERISDDTAKLYGTVNTTSLEIPVAVISTMMDPTCETVTENVTITVHPNPAVKIAELPNVCPALQTQAVTANITTATTANYTYNWSGGTWIDPMTTVTDASSNTVNANVPTICLDSVFLRVEVLDAYGCYAKDSTMMIVSDTTKPRIAVNEGFDVVLPINRNNCNYEVMSMAGYVTVEDPCTMSNQFTIKQDVPAGTFLGANEPEKQVKVWVEGSCNSSDTVMITVRKPEPVEVHITAVDTICNGSSTVMTASAENGYPGEFLYTWTPNTGLSSTNQAVVTANPTSTTTYTVMVRDGNGCIDTAKKTLYVYPLPMVTIDPVAVVCPNAGETYVTARVNANGGTATQFGYEWTSNFYHATAMNGTTNQQQVTNIPTINDQRYTLYLTVTENVMGCSTTDSTVITVKDEVAPTIEVNKNSVLALPGDAPCTYILPNLADSVVFTVGDNCTPAEDIQIVQTIASGASITASKPVWVVAEDAYGNRDSVAVTVMIPNEFSLTIVDNTETPVSCPGGHDGSVLINYPTQGGTEPYHFFVNGDEPDSIHVYTNSMRLYGLGGGTNTISAVDKNGCAASVQVEIAEPDEMMVEITTVPATCANNDGQVTITVTGGTSFVDNGYSYRLLGDLEYGEPQFRDTLAGVSPKVVSSRKVGHYHLEIMDAMGCMYTDSFDIALNNNLVIDNIPAPKPICSGGQFSVTPVTNTPGMTYYTWSAPDQSVANGVSGTAPSPEDIVHYPQYTVNGTNLVNNTGNVPVNLTYHVTAHNGVCTFDTNIVMTVTTTVRPQVVITPKSDTVCPGTLVDGYYMTAKIANVYADLDTLIWYFRGDSIGRTTHAYPDTAYSERHLVTMANPEYAQVYPFTVEYSDGVCTNSASGTVTVKIPNHFTIEMPAVTDTTVNCYADIWVNQPHQSPSTKMPAHVYDGCGQEVTYRTEYPYFWTSPSYLSCGGTVVFHYRYVDGSNNDTVYEYTYHVLTPGMTLPANGSSSVTCESDAKMPQHPGGLSDACHMNVMPTFPETWEGNPNPMSTVGEDNSGTVTYTFLYTTCDGQVYPWQYVYTVTPDPFTPFDTVRREYTCRSELDTLVVPVPDVTICDKHIDFTLNTNYPQSTFNEGCGTLTYRYDYRVNGEDYQWYFIASVKPEDFAKPADQMRVVSCYSEIDISSIQLPVVKNDCQDVINPVSTTPVVTPAESEWTECTDTVVCTYTYEDCVGHTFEWHYKWVVKDTVPPVFTTLPVNNVIAAERLFDINGQCAYAYPKVSLNDVNAESACTLGKGGTISWDQDYDPSWFGYTYIEQVDTIQHLPIEVRAISPCGVTNRVTVMVEVPAKLKVNELVSSHKNLKCYGGHDGEIRVQATGGVPLYTYTISEPTAVQTQSGYFTNLPVPADSAIGVSDTSLVRYLTTYGVDYWDTVPNHIWYGHDVVTVTDAHGCTATDTIEVSSPVYVEWTHCQDMVLCADPGKDYRTVTIGVDFVPPTLSTNANSPRVTNIRIADTYAVGVTPIRFTLNDRVCGGGTQNCYVNIQVLPNPTVKDSAANMRQEVCPNADIDPIVFTFADADSVVMTGDLPASMVTYETTQLNEYRSETQVTISGNPNVNAPAVLNYLFKAYGQALPGTDVPCSEVSYSGALTIHDTVAPTYTKPEDVVLYANAQCEVDTTAATTGMLTNDNIEDNCATEFTISHRDVVANGECAGAYTIQRVWRVVDPSGNISKSDSIQTITVLDTVRPVITPNHPTVFAAIPNSNCNSDVPNVCDSIAKYASDNCSTTLTVTQMPVAGTEIMDDTPVTVTVADACGNVATATVNVTASGVVAVTIDSVDAGCYLNPADGAVYFTIYGEQEDYMTSVNGVNYVIEPETQMVIEGLAYGDDHLIEIFPYIPGTTERCHYKKNFSIQPIAETLTVTANSGEWEYDTEEHENRSFRVQFGDQVVSDSVASGTFVTLPTGDQVSIVVTGAITDAGTVENVLSDLLVMRGNTNVTCKYNQVLNNGILTVNPAEVTVTITGHHLVANYTGTEHVVTGYDVTFSDAFYTTDHFAFNGSDTAKRTDAGTTYMGLASDQFVSIWPTPNNIASVTFVVAEDGYMLVNKINATVNIAGHYDVLNFDGEEHVVKGYNTTFSTPLYTRNDFEFTGDSTLARTNAGTTNMNLAPAQFANISPNFETVTFIVDADGYLTINPIDVTVTVTGHTSTADYDGEEHVIAGYDLLYSTPLYKAQYFTFSGVDTAKRTVAGTTNMGLNANQFANTNPNFATVTFNVTDGWMRIDPINAVVTIVGNHATVDFDGESHTITGYLATANPANLYDVTTSFTFGGDSTATRTNAGTTNMGLAASQFHNTNTNFGTVTFNVTDGYMTINQINATVTITGHNNTVNYDRTEHAVSGYDVEITPSIYTVADYEFNGTAAAARTEVGTTNMGLAASQFHNTNSNFATVTFNVTDGFQTILPLDVVVTVTGHQSTLTFDNQQHTVTGFDTTYSSPYYTANDFTFNGTATASRTNVVEGTDVDGQTDMGLTANMFTNLNPNCNVTFNVTDGYQKIMPVDDVVVTIAGQQSSVFYDGEEHSVSGYSVAINHPLYHQSDYTFNGTAEASRTDVGTAYMGLNADQFTNINTNFTNVTFDVTDGHQIVEPNSAQVTIIGHTRTVAYNGSEQTVTGYDVVSSNTLYGAADFTFTNGDSTATRQFVGTTSMGLNETMFHNTNPNFAGNVTFTVQDGSITVTPANAVVTIVGANNTTAYDGAQHTVTGFTPTADLTFYNVDTSFTFTPAANAVMVGDEIAAKRTDAGTTNMGLAVSQFANTNPNFNVTFNVTDGYQTITPLDVTVIITGANNTTAYDREEHSVSGYDVQVSSPLYTENDFAFNGTAYAAQTEIGTANMGLDADQFVNNNNNFNVTFDVTDGYQTITRVTGVVVTITGHNKTEHYNGSEQSVSGYEVSTNNTLYTEADFTFDGTAYAARTDTGIVWMGLEGHFANTNDNFSGVTFNVTDGFMRVTQLPVTVTVTGHSDSRYFDNAQHEVSGFDTVISSPLYTAADFTFAGNNAYASRTHVVEGNDNTGKTMMGLDVAHFTNTNANFDVTFNVTDGYQEIMPVDDVVVTIKGTQSSVFYDGEEHSVSGYAATINHPLYHESDYDFNGTAAAAQTNVGTAYMGLNASQFTNHNTDFTNVTFDVTDGHQIVEPNSAQVTIIGHTRTVTYNGEAQVVKGYEIQSSNTLYGAADFTFAGDSTATRQFVGTTTMGLSEAMFQNTNPNFVNNVTFTVQDGSITVVPADAVVTIVGKNNTAPYDGAEHTVTGYTSTADLTFYNVDTSFTFNGTAQASRTFVGTTNMGLAVGQFTNKNPNFNVTFNVTDGYQTITPIDVTVTIVGDHNTAPYDGSVHTVTGYTATANPTIYNVDTSFTFSGPTTVSRTDAGTTNMGLTADQFANTNPNFANVTFNVTDGYQTITPINAVVTVVGNHAENVFDNAAHTVTGFTATANTNLYKTTGNNRDFTFEGQATATRTSVVEGADNSGKTMMGLTADMFANTNSNFATVTFNVTDGYQKINQAPVTVTIKGAVDSVLYLDQVEQSVHGYEVTSISNPLYTEENFSYVGDADDTVATGMAVATYYMNLSAQSFQDNGTDYCKNFAPTFNVTNGHIAILSRHVTVTIAGNADTVEYDGQSHQVNGYQVVNIDQPHYTANDFSFDGAATASRTNAGTTSMGLAAEQFHNQNANYQEVTFVVTDGFVTVTPKPIAVTVTGNNDTANYTGAAHTVTGFEYATAETLYNTDSCEYHGTQADSTATRTDAGTTPMGLTADEFVNTDDNFTVTFNVVDGYQYVVPDTVKVTITGQHNEFAYDNDEHTVSGYTFATTPAQTAYDPYAYVTFVGTTQATASRTDAGTTNMGLTAAMFGNSNVNYYVTFEVTDGYVKVNALPVTVNVEGNTGVFVYDNASHTVSGYTVTATSDLFDVNCIQLVNGTTASVSATNANTNLYPMNLSQNSFQNTCNNSNFDVTIQVTDGWLRILGENDVYVKITGHRDTAYYDGASHTVNGYDVETVPANYTAYTFNGTATAARTNVVEGNDASGKTFMNLAVNQFSSTNNNYNVIFDVEDGYIWIKPIDTMVVTITGNTATQTYTRTEHTVTGYTSTANTTLFDANKVVFNGNSTASRTLAGTTHMGLVASQFSYNDQNFTNVTFNVHDGAMTVSKKPISIIGDTIFHKIYDGDSLRVRYDLLTYNGFVDGDVITTGEIVTMGSHIGTYLCNQNNFMAFNDETYVAENRLFGEPSVIQNYAPAFNVTLRIDPVQELNVPDTVRIVLTEGTADTTVTTVEIGTPDNELPGTTIVNNLPDVNPLPADTTRVTWTIYDNEGNEMTHNDQVVIVVYAPCDTIEYNGYAYPAKRIGYQCWMTENLRTETYADGTTPVADYHAYMDNSANLEKFGYLYTWYSAVNVPENNNSATPAVLTAANGTSYVQGVCPEGWAVASVADYDVLYLHVGDVILLKDAGEGYWYPGNGGVLPNSGFNSRAGGLFKSMNDRYEDILTGDHYWKSDSTPNSANATSGNINYFCDAPSEVQSPKTDRKSVRCIKKR